MEPYLIRLIIISVLAFSPFLARLLYLLVFNELRGGLVARNFLISLVLFLIFLGASTYAIDSLFYSNRDFTLFVFLLSFFGLFAHLKAIPAAYRQTDGKELQHRRNWQAICMSCIAMGFLCAMLFDSADAMVFERQVDQAELPKVVCVPQRIHIAIIDGEERFQIWPRELSFSQESKRHTLIEIVPTSAERELLFGFYRNLREHPVSTVLVFDCPNVVEHDKYKILKAESVTRSSHR